MSARNVVRIAVVAALLAGGCTSIDLDRTFTRQDANSAQASFDEWQCRRQIEGSVRTPDLIVGGVADAGRIALESWVRDADLAHCMRSRGYETTRASREADGLTTAGL